MRALILSGRRSPKFKAPHTRMLRHPNAIRRIREPRRWIGPGMIGIRNGVQKAGNPGDPGTGRRGFLAAPYLSLYIIYIMRISARLRTRPGRPLALKDVRRLAWRLCARWIDGREMALPLWSGLVRLSPAACAGACLLYPIGRRCWRNSRKVEARWNRTAAWVQRGSPARTAAMISRCCSTLRSMSSVL